MKHDWHVKDDTHCKHVFFNINKGGELAGEEFSKIT